MADLRSHLRTGRGLAWLFAATYLGALALACVLASQRERFHGLMAEKYPPPSAEAGALASDLALGRAPPATIQELPEPRRAELYHVWMLGPQPGQPALARALAQGDPALARTLVERTLVAGDAAQRRRAVAFALAAGTGDLRDALAWARERAARTRDPFGPELERLANGDGAR